MKINLILSLLLTLPVSLYAADQPENSNPFSDPALQDYMETADGYLNSKNTMNVRADFGAPGDLRDAPSAVTAPTLKNPAPAAAVSRTAPSADKEPAQALPGGHYKVTFAGESGPLGSFVWPVGTGPKKFAREYVFLTVTPASADYDTLLRSLEKNAGFRFTGENTSYAGSVKRTVIMGWAPYSAVTAISKTKGVVKVSVEKKNTGVPLKTRVRFTLKVPYQNKPSAFVPDFLKKLSDENGFTAENWFRLPKNAAESKFSVFDVTGTMPVDMVGELSRSPFVASVEFNDSSL